jgi:hypothetical protein
MCRKKNTKQLAHAGKNNTKQLDHVFMLNKALHIILPFSVIIKTYQCWAEVWFGRSEIPVLLRKKPTAIGSDFRNQNRNQN